MPHTASAHRLNSAPAQRYYFDINDGTEVRDEIGRVLEGGEILRAEALRVITRLTAAEAEEARETTLVLAVRDQVGKTALKVRIVCQLEEAV
ncbi:hypothetical protein HCU64_17705 [Methylobacterium sp. C25]|uniref:DUF6894 family protein n=1 Tax=Methylobacterium sp. C25 TaxID=2721622 RepID=UPI001F33D21B|nr:hypothetical protein [Methylobacterium sp. C25]MCE4225591.1 hypothetical protein [Methylobacterium sp. C25]